MLLNGIKNKCDIALVLNFNVFIIVLYYLTFEGIFKMKASKLTGNQIVAQYILGYIPKGYTQCVERCNNGRNYRIGEIYINNFKIASIPGFLNGNTLPSSKDIMANKL